MTNDRPDDQARRRRLFGRRRGRPLRAGRAALVDRLLPDLSFDLPETGDLAPEALFGNAPEDVWLEIGFGAGEHLAEMAAAHPSVGLIGCEVFIDGIASLIRHIDERGLANIRIFQADARGLIERLPDASLGRIFLLHPDPWPKRRHAGRRFVQPESLADLARILRPGGELRIATDDPVYLEWTLRHMTAATGFDWQARQADDWRRRPSDWPETRYEQKALKAGRRCTYLRYLRR